MRTFLLVSAAVLTMATPSFAAKAVPCEKMLEDLRAAVKTAKLGDADRAKVDELESKGIERCNADDDERADGFFTDAMKIVHK